MQEINFGIAAYFWEIKFAYDLQKLGELHEITDRKTNLGSYVLILSIISIAIGILSGGIAIILSMGIGLWATCLVQIEINHLSDKLEMFNNR